MSAGLRIEHTLPHTDPYVVFWSFAIATTIGHITQLGYRVE